MKFFIKYCKRLTDVIYKYYKCITKVLLKYTKTTYKRSKLYIWNCPKYVFRTKNKLLFVKKKWKLKFKTLEIHYYWFNWGRVFAYSILLVKTNTFQYVQWFFNKTQLWGRVFALRFVRIKPLCENPTPKLTYFSRARNYTNPMPGNAISGCMRQQCVIYLDMLIVQYYCCTKKSTYV